ALISNGQVSVQLEPGPHIADEPFACFDARLQHDVEDPAASFRQVMGVSNGCLNGISPTLRSRCVSCASTPPWTVLPLPSQPGDGQQEGQGDQGDQGVRADVEEDLRVPAPARGWPTRRAAGTKVKP